MARCIGVIIEFAIVGALFGAPGIVAWLGLYLLAIVIFGLAAAGY